jgi:hypothetical protein
MLYPEPEKGGRGKKAQNSKETLGFSMMRLSQARAVLAYSPELAAAVRDVRSSDQVVRPSGRRVLAAHIIGGDDGPSRRVIALRIAERQRAGEPRQVVQQLTITERRRRSAADVRAVGARPNEATGRA